MTCNEFKKAMEEQFGPLEWRATSGDFVKTSKGWPSSPRHPVNQTDTGAIAWSGNAQRGAERTQQ